MTITERLSQRIGLTDIHEMIALMQHDDEMKQKLFSLLFDTDEKLAYRAAWVMSHFSTKENGWLIKKQDELIDEAMICEHSGKRRVILNVLYLQPLCKNSRMDFLDFCLERIISKTELPGVQSLCMKIAYEICRPNPDLTHELRTTLDLMDDELSPAIYAAKRNIVKAMRKKSTRR